MLTLIEKWQNQNNAWRIEGSEGVANFRKLVMALGYGDSYQGPLEEFLCDNSGALYAMVEWIANADVTEWKDSLEAEVEHLDDDEQQRRDEKNGLYLDKDDIAN